MNRKGQMAFIGTILGVFMMVIIGLALYSGGIISNIDLSTQKLVANHTFTTPAVNETINLNGKALDDDISVIFESNGTPLAAADYSIADNQVVNGELTATYTTTDDGNVAGHSSLSVNSSYTYEPVGYITDSGGRSLALLIAVFTALAIAVVALTPTLRSGVLEAFGR